MLTKATALSSPLRASAAGTKQRLVPASHILSFHRVDRSTPCLGGPSHTLKPPFRTIGPRWGPLGLVSACWGLGGWSGAPLIQEYTLHHIGIANMIEGIFIFPH